MHNYNLYPNIIFDFGGVLLNIDTNRAVKGFEYLGLTDSSVITLEFQENGVFDLLEKGEITPVEFRTGIRKYLRPDVTDMEIDIAWNSMLLDLPAERIELLQRLKNKHRIFLLSNTNQIHWEKYTSLIHQEHGVWLSSLFEKDFYSHNMGLRKPDSRIYSKVLEDKGLKPHETLFVDDTLINVDAARKLGMGGHYLDLEKGESVIDLFSI